MFEAITTAPPPALKGDQKTHPSLNPFLNTLRISSKFRTSYLILGAFCKVNLFIEAFGKMVDLGKKGRSLHGQHAWQKTLQKF